jgi:hypothetical protein
MIDKDRFALEENRVEFKVHINLGNRNMENSAHVANALISLGEKIKEEISFPKELQFPAGSIKDVIGNPVGEWKFDISETPHQTEYDDFDKKVWAVVCYKLGAWLNTKGEHIYSSMVSLWAKDKDCPEPMTKEEADRARSSCLHCKMVRHPKHQG